MSWDIFGAEILQLIDCRQPKSTSCVVRPDEGFTTTCTLIIAIWILGVFCIKNNAIFLFLYRFTFNSTGL